MSSLGSCSPKSKLAVGRSCTAHGTYTSTSLRPISTNPTSPARQSSGERRQSYAAREQGARTCRRDRAPAFVSRTRSGARGLGSGATSGIERAQGTTKKRRSEGALNTSKPLRFSEVRSGIRPRCAGSFGSCPRQSRLALAREMALTFTMAPGSPYSWRVFFALEHKGVAHEAQVLSFSQREHLSPESSPSIRATRCRPSSTTGSPLRVERHPRVPGRAFPGAKLFSAISAPARRRGGSSRKSTTTCSATATSFATSLLQVGSGDGRHGRPRRRSARRLEEWGALRARAPGRLLAGRASPPTSRSTWLLAMAARYDKKRPELELVASIPTGLKAWMGRIEALPYFDKTYPPHWR